ncbi:serine/threonine-protein kinase [Thermogemmatispora carboxidivorans]|uniref:serine/threonine-protein kinase n=1 Tax=Thermogemmatispora carboxidivorans TaxID=1382306 RepID=UPI00069A7152|nr:serine/threonine-protein kinase [Thermogemmatispora carboxidivorans]
MIRQGQRLGNYRLIRLLGSGSYGAVYLAEHLYLRTQVAIKVLTQLLKEEDEQAFLHEAQILASLRHKHIVPVHEFAIERGQPYLVMDYLPGGTLLDRHARGARLPLATVVSYVYQLASALQYAHDHDIVHRDVKPANILLGREGLLLSDFGIALPLLGKDGMSAGESALVGTLPYMAPEQFRSQPTFASDQYALAVIAYELLCGVRPFQGRGAELIGQHLSQEPPSLREHDPSLPESVDRVILRALAKKVEERYPAIILFARALGRAAEQALSDSDVERSLTLDLETLLPVVPPGPGDGERNWRVILAIGDEQSPASQHLQQALQERGLTVIMARSCEQAGELALRQAMRAAQLLLVALTTQDQTLPVSEQLLQMAHLYRRPVRYLLVGTPPPTGSTWQLIEAVPPALLSDGSGLRYRQALDELIGQIKDEQGGRQSQKKEILTSGRIATRNPYKGLRAFTQDDQGDFFGRERLVQELLSRLFALLGREPSHSSAARLLALIGGVGVGKSSLLMAGLLPRLQAGALPGSQNWRYLAVFRPAYRPLEALAEVLAAGGSQQEKDAIHTTLVQGDSTALHRLALTLAPDHPYVVLVIDQFEELFSPEVTEAERRRFIELIATAVSVPYGKLILLLTLRADCYDRPLAYPALAQLLQGPAHCPIGPMTLDELRAVIEQPALLPDVQLVFDEDLVADLLLDIRDQPGALPLLEFTLDQLFEQRRGNRLTRRAYEAIGGVRGALARHAEATYAGLPTDRHRFLACQLFLRLIQPGREGLAPLRRQARQSEFALTDEQQTRLMQETCQAFVAARLLTVERRAGEVTLEVSHEALLQEWPRLVDWVRQAGEDLPLQQRVSADVQEWWRRGKPRDRLYRGSQLKEALRWQERTPVSAQEAAFLRASQRARTLARVRLVLVIFLILALLIPAGWLLYQQVAPLQVTSLQDDGPGSLRQVIAEAKPGQTISVQPGLSGVLSLTHNLDIGKNLTIRGPGAARLTISGQPGLEASYAIRILARTSVTFSDFSFSERQPSPGDFFLNQGKLTLQRCRIAQIAIPPLNGSGGSEQAGGSAIDNSRQGELTLQQSVITHIQNRGQAAHAAAILNDGGKTIVSASQITDNSVNDTGRGGNDAAGGVIVSLKGTLTMTDSIVSGNQVDSLEHAYGGGIFALDSTVQLTNTRLVNNSIVAAQQGAGAGLQASGSQVTLKNTLVAGNSVKAHFAIGGGLVLSGGASGKLTLIGSTVTGNRVSTQDDLAVGGGVLAEGELVINNSTISRNVAVSTTSSGSASGGGIAIMGNLVMTASTVANNLAQSLADDAEGGGILALPPTSGVGLQETKLSLVNSTLSENSAQGKRGSLGGGLLVDGSSARLDFCTIYDNHASAGGGLTVVTESGHSTQVTLLNSLVAANTADQDPDLVGQVTSGGYNLIQRTAGATFLDPFKRHHLDLVGTGSTPLAIDSQLRANGGPTQTHALLIGSPAINRIPAADCDVKTDQRGLPRPQQGACDIGAYEYSPATQ